MERTVLNSGRDKGAGALLDPGLGKSSICLDFLRLLRQCGDCRRALIVAPLRVIQNVWPAERSRWIQFADMPMVTISGDSRARLKAVGQPTFIHLISRDNLKWLANLLRGRTRIPWDVVIFDESTNYKNWSARRSQAARFIASRVPMRVILTGSPMPNRLVDMHGQIHLLDTGESLGHTLGAFQARFCFAKGFGVRQTFEVRDDKRQELLDSIQHLCLRLDARDHLSIPEKVHQTVMVDMPPASLVEYQNMERNLFIALSEGASSRDIAGPAGAYTACRQVANGGLYDSDRVAHHIHDAKTEAVVDIIEELQGKPLLIAYHYGHDLTRLKQAIPGLHSIHGGMNQKEVTSIINRWNTDTLHPPYLAVQPMSMAYGVNMQQGLCRHVLWYGPTDNLEVFLQFNARVHRQGVGSGVVVTQLCCRDTIDELMWDRLAAKDDLQSTLLESLRQYAISRGAA